MAAMAYALTGFRLYLPLREAGAGPSQFPLEPSTGQGGHRAAASGLALQSRAAEECGEGAAGRWGRALRGVSPDLKPKGHTECH